MSLTLFSQAASEEAAVSMLPFDDIRPVAEAFFLQPVNLIFVCDDLEQREQIKALLGAKTKGNRIQARALLQGVAGEGMKTLLVNTAKIGASPMSAHTRNALILSRELGLDLISTLEEARTLDIQNYARFAIIGAAFYDQGCALVNRLRENKDAEITWITNEYDVSPNGEYARLLKERSGSVIANFAPGDGKFKAATKWHTLNLNALLLSEAQQVIHKKYDLLYYGTWRPGRRDYFARYFGDEAGEFYLSSSPRNLKKFKQLGGCTAKFCNKLSWAPGRESLNLFRYSLYIEDAHTHTHYNFPANRFYECLSCNVVQFFDVSCRSTLDKSFIDPGKFFIVKDADELRHRIAQTNFEHELALQQSEWMGAAGHQRKRVIGELRELLT